MEKLNRLIGLTFIAAVFAAGCSDEPAAPVEETSEVARVIAMNHPLLYFARRLSGGAMEAKLLAPLGTDPALWAPEVADVLMLQAADLVLLNGAGYEGWLDKVSISAGKLVDTSAGFRDRWIRVEDQVTHSHGPQGEHAHGDFAFTTWMDMSLARAQAEAVARALADLSPSLAGKIDSELTSLLADLDALDAGYREAAASLGDRKPVYSHPVYQYFERRYDLYGSSLHWEPDVMPSEAEWDGLVALAGSDSILFVWEGEPVAEITTRMSALGIDSVVVEPGANRDARDWLRVQQENLDRLAGLAGE